MMQKILKYSILALFVVNLPMVALNNFGATIGSVFSYSSFFLLVIYYLFYLVGQRPNLWLLVLGLTYFSIAGFQSHFSLELKTWVIDMLKYCTLMLFGNAFFRQVSKKEMLFFLLIGALSVMANGFFIPSEYGRASGFYYNANPAGLACLFGYALAYGLKPGKLRQVLQIAFTIAGFVTFSRTFIVIWIIINLFSLKKSFKNFRILAIGVAAFISLFVLGEALNLGGKRFETFKAAIGKKKPKNKLDEDSRTNTWALYYDYMVKSPIEGNGYGSFGSDGIRRVGVHNTYFLILGEAGVIPFLLFIGLIYYLNVKSWQYFHQDDSLLYISITISLYLLTLHDFFDFYFMLTIVLFWYNQVSMAIEENRMESNETSSLPKYGL